MSFSFNFEINAENENCDRVGVTSTNDASVTDDKTLCIKQGGDQDREPEAKEVVLEWENVEGDTEQITLLNKEVMHTVCVSALEEHLKIQEAEGETTRDDSVLLKAVASNSDLIPRVYEGGMTIWECSLDLANYLSSLDIAFRGLKVLELGCGAGLPGLYALRHGAEVHFQDYNAEVLERVTIPNVLLNSGEDVEKEELESTCKFYAGSWKSLTPLFASSNKKDDGNHKYDLILTSETIYCPAYYRQLLDIMAETLKPDGKIYVAAKTYYFGVGGGTRAFEELVKEEGIFTINVGKEFNEGVKREILVMKNASRR